jgi:hypothetical protein
LSAAAVQELEQREAAGMQAAAVAAACFTQLAYT